MKISKSQMQSVLTCYDIIVRNDSLNLNPFSSYYLNVWIQGPLSAFMNVLIIEISPSLVTIYLFQDYYLFKLNRTLASLNRALVQNDSIRKIDNGSESVGRKDCKRENLFCYNIWYFYLNAAQTCHKYSKISLL